ncbi:MAG: hypothetical protein ACI89E_001929, partial [Planctomycetota bacterium]
MAPECASCVARNVAGNKAVHAINILMAIEVEIGQ